MNASYSYDVIIVGAGAAGLICAAEAGRRGRRVWLIDHAAKIAEKIRISGGGRCNFTNIHTRPENFLSRNPHFCKSALKRFTPQDFVLRVERHGIAWHEKKLGQLFCDDSAQQVIDMLLDDCADAGVTLDTETSVLGVSRDGRGYAVRTSRGERTCASLVIATGGLSIPKIGATGLGYDIARQFGLEIAPTRAGLVPLTFDGPLLARCKALSGVSAEAEVACGKARFAEGFLFTHRGFSGPSILQISSYREEGGEIVVNLAPGEDMLSVLKAAKQERPAQHVHNVLAERLPRRLAQDICDALGCGGHLGGVTDRQLAALAQAVNGWRVTPTGCEGYRTAEVTLGGVDTAALSSQTMEARNHPGLFFIGEVVDVTGHLGGFNFQWAWSSGVAAGLAI